MELQDALQHFLQSSFEHLRNFKVSFSLYFLVPAIFETEFLALIVVMIKNDKMAKITLEGKL